MNKQKTLIFSLSAILFLALSFIVYSWSEPTTNMPSGYTAPLNTSSNFQEKYGPLIFPMMYDGDTCDDPSTGNCPYYINPSGDSIVSGTISAANPTKNNHIATKGYIDGLFGNVEKAVSLSNLVYIADKQNPSCLEADSIIIMKHCVSTNTWVSSNVSCDSDAVICVQIEQPLFDKHHTEEQCRIWGGQPVIVENNVRICKFNSATCPGGWDQYKNWSTTVPGQSPFPISASAPSGPYYYTGSHAWSNTGIESLYCNRCIGTMSNNEFCGTNDYCSNRRYYYYASVTEIGCY
ncbi:MAG: hypothetical protein PHU74_02095 [Candidatus Pacebacteria bacterium]|nr:hypothetical protein [Candidatus Paceibacterota bacterium]